MHKSFGTTQWYSQILKILKNQKNDCKDTQRYRQRIKNKIRKSIDIMNTKFSREEKEREALKKKNQIEITEMNRSISNNVQ